MQCTRENSKFGNYVENNTNTYMLRALLLIFSSQSTPDRYLRCVRILQNVIWKN